MLRLSEKTYSLWGFLIANNDDFANPLYDAAAKWQGGDPVLRPSVVPQNIKFWTGLYCRFENGT